MFALTVAQFLASTSHFALLMKQTRGMKANTPGPKAERILIPGFRTYDPAPYPRRPVF